MKQKIKNIFSTNNIFAIYIITQSVLDSLTSICVRNINENFSIGIIVRTTFMIVMVILALIKSDKKYRTKFLFYYLFLGIYFLIFMINLYKDFGRNLFFYQIKSLIKVFYFPIMLVALFPLFRKKILKLKQSTLIYTLIGYMFFIFIFKVLNLFYNSYPSDSNMGTMGLFFAANEIGAIISVLSAYLVYSLLNEKVNILNIVALFLFIFTSLELGTKVPFISLIIIIIFAIYSCFLKLFDKVQRKRGIINFMVISFICVFLFFTIPYTPIGKNLAKTYNIKYIYFFKYNKVCEQNTNKTEVKTEVKNEVKAEVKTEVKNEVKAEVNTDNKIEQDIQLTTALLSSRDSYLKNNLEKFKNSSIINRFFGIGYIYLENDRYEPLKLIEMDYIDILFCQGFIGTILYFVPVITILAIIMINSIRKVGVLITKQRIIFILYSVILSLTIALIAGHVLTAPSVSLLVIIFIILLKDEITNIRSK